MVLFIVLFELQKGDHYECKRKNRKDKTISILLFGKKLKNEQT